MAGWLKHIADGIGGLLGKASGAASGKDASEPKPLSRERKELQNSVRTQLVEELKRERKAKAAAAKAAAKAAADAEAAKQAPKTDPAADRKPTRWAQKAAEAAPAASAAPAAGGADFKASEYKIEFSAADDAALRKPPAGDGRQSRFDFSGKKQKSSEPLDPDLLPELDPEYAFGAHSAPEPRKPISARSETPKERRERREDFSQTVREVQRIDPKLPKILADQVQPPPEYFGFSSNMPLDEPSAPEPAPQLAPEPPAPPPPEPKPFPRFAVGEPTVASARAPAKPASSAPPAAVGGLLPSSGFEELLGAPLIPRCPSENRTSVVERGLARPDEPIKSAWERMLEFDPAAPAQPIDSDPFADLISARLQMPDEPIDSNPTADLISARLQMPDEPIDSDPMADLISARLQMPDEPIDSDPMADLVSERLQRPDEPIDSDPMADLVSERLQRPDEPIKSAQDAPFAGMNDLLSELVGAFLAPQPGPSRPALDSEFPGRYDVEFEIDLDSEAAVPPAPASEAAEDAAFARRIAERMAARLSERDA